MVGCGSTPSSIERRTSRSDKFKALIEQRIDLPGLEVSPVSVSGDHDEIQARNHGAAISTKPKRHDRVAGCVGPCQLVGMACSLRIEPPIETVNARPRVRKMIGVAAVSTDVQIVIGWGVAAESQILGDLWPHIIVKIGTREQLLSVPIPPI
jgi:hypothetical protein